MAFCAYCGREIKEDTKFCPECGQPVEIKETISDFNAEKSEYSPAKEETTNVSWSETANNEGVNESESIPVMIFGIISLCFATTPFCHILGLIFGAIGLKKYKYYINNGGVENVKTKIGRIMSTVGLILSIVCLAIVALYVICLIVVVIVNSINYTGNSFNSFEF